VQNSTWRIFVVFHTTLLKIRIYFRANCKSLNDRMPAYYGWELNFLHQVRCRAHRAWCKKYRYRRKRLAPFGLRRMHNVLLWFQNSTDRGYALFWNQSNPQHMRSQCGYPDFCNWLISIIIYTFGCLISIVGIVLLPFLAVFQLVMVIIASIKTHDGEDYKYPITIRLIK